MRGRAQSSWRYKFGLCALAFAFIPALGIAPSSGQQQSAEKYYQNQMKNQAAGLPNQAAAAGRIVAIHDELIAYSRADFPVYPVRQFTGALSTPAGIYFDISMAADPSIEITRFVLAHEWEHMINGDPLRSFSGYTPYMMEGSPTLAEEAADIYAANFMREQRHDIEPVLQFLCALPDLGPSDTHRSGRVRAEAVAETYYATKLDPCVPGSDRAERNGQALQAAGR